MITTLGMDIVGFFACAGVMLVMGLCCLEECQRGFPLPRMIAATIAVELGMGWAAGRLAWLVAGTLGWR